MGEIPLRLLERVLRPHSSDPPSPRNMMTEELRSKLRAYDDHGMTPEEAWRDLVDHRDTWTPPTTPRMRLKAVSAERRSTVGETQWLFGPSSAYVRPHG